MRVLEFPEQRLPEQWGHFWLVLPAEVGFAGSRRPRPLSLQISADLSGILLPRVFRDGRKVLALVCFSSGQFQKRVSRRRELSGADATRAWRGTRSRGSCPRAETEKKTASCSTPQKEKAPTAAVISVCFWFECIF